MPFKLNKSLSELVQSVVYSSVIFKYLFVYVSYSFFFSQLNHDSLWVFFFFLSFVLH